MIDTVGVELIDQYDREFLLDYASDITTEVADEHRVVDHARELEAWVVAAGRRLDAELRMTALRRVVKNLARAGKLPMDQPGELVGRAALMYVFLGGDPWLVGQGAPDRTPIDAPQYVACTTGVIVLPEDPRD